MMMVMMVAPSAVGLDLLLTGPMAAIMPQLAVPSAVGRDLLLTGRGRRAMAHSKALSHMQPKSS